MENYNDEHLDASSTSSPSVAHISLALFLRRTAIRARQIALLLATSTPSHTESSTESTSASTLDSEGIELCSVTHATIHAAIFYFKYLFITNTYSARVGHYRRGVNYKHKGHILNFKKNSIISFMVLQIQKS